MPPPRVESVWKKLPEDLAMDILSRLEGKELVRNKIVCPAWRSTIESPFFSNQFRKHHDLLIYNWSEDVPAPPESVRFRVYSTELNRPEEFRMQMDLHPRKRFDIVTQVVDGMVCVATFEGSDFWTREIAEVHLYNVYTGQRILVTKPKVRPSTVSSFHLGKDPVTKTFKLLHIIYPCNFQGIMTGPISVKIMNLRYSGLGSFVWRNLKPKEAGLECFSVFGREYSYAFSSLGFHQAMTFPGDRALCWFWIQGKSLIWFDLSEEKFQMVKLPKEIPDKLLNAKDLRLPIIPRCTPSSLSLWMGPRSGELGTEWYVLDEKLKWSKHVSPFSALPEFMLMDTDHSPDSMTVCSYPMRLERFITGRLPENRHLEYNVVWTGLESLGFDTRLTRLSDSAYSYLSLADILH